MAPKRKRRLYTAMYREKNSDGKWSGDTRFIVATTARNAMNVFYKKHPKASLHNLTRLEDKVLIGK